MNSWIIDGTPIAVDYWRKMDSAENYIYFLTHIHSDHTKGLTSSWRHPIYTSHVNKLLIEKKFKFDKDVVKALELNESHVINGFGETDTISVTLIDANHVPGSVLFLFEGRFGNILYTGDMRFYPEVLHHPALSDLIADRAIDRLYLDNTFCHPAYDFPSRETAIKRVFKIIEDHPDHIVKIGVRNIGKEEVLEAVAFKFKRLVQVTESKLFQLQMMNRPNVYTTAEDSIQAVLLNKVNARTMSQWKSEAPTVCIFLTALYYGLGTNEVSLLQTPGIHVVPYSDHSSWGELHDFVKGLKPCKIFPIVRDSMKKDMISSFLSSRSDMSVFDSYLSPPRDGVTSTAVTSKSFDSAFILPNVSKSRLCDKRSQKSKFKKSTKKRGFEYEDYEYDSSAAIESGKLSVVTNDICEEELYPAHRSLESPENPEKSVQKNHSIYTLCELIKDSLSGNSKESIQEPLTGSQPERSLLENEIQPGASHTRDHPSTEGNNTELPLKNIQIKVENPSECTIGRGVVPINESVAENSGVQQDTDFKNLLNVVEGSNLRIKVLANVLDKDFTLNSLDEAILNTESIVSQLDSFNNLF